MDRVRIREGLIAPYYRRLRENSTFYQNLTKKSGPEKFSY